MVPKGRVQIRAKRQDQRKSQKLDRLCREGEHSTMIKTRLPHFWGAEDDLPVKD